MTPLQHQEATKIVAMIALQAKELIQLTRGMNDKDAKGIIGGLDHILTGCSEISKTLKQTA